jgi:hypothetical protein
MIEIALTLFGLLAVMFVGIVVIGAPYVPSKRVHINDAFELLDLQKGQLLIELGCGDGRVLKAAAARGLSARGYELNLVLFLIAYVRCWSVRDRVKVVWGDYWHADLSDADGIFIFSAEMFMKRLDKKIIRTSHAMRLASVGFGVPGRKMTRSKGAIKLYQYT